MYVLSASLDPADVASLEQACARTRIGLRVTDPREPEPTELDLRVPETTELDPPEPDPREPEPVFGEDLLAVFYRGDGAPPAEYTAARRAGVHTVEVQSRASALATLAAVRGGCGFVLASPLGVDRLTKFLDYLAKVAAPPGAQVLTLADDGTLTTPSGAVRLDPAEATTLRLLGERPDGIVSREQITSASGGLDPLLLVAELRRRFDAVGSGAQILKVPHMGFRLVGRVRAVVAGQAFVSQSGESRTEGTN